MPTRLSMLLVVAAVAFSMGLATSATHCPIAPYGACGSAHQITCCPESQYCQPWDPGFYQCMPRPRRCRRQLPNVDLYGQDLKALYDLQPSDCCTQCAETRGCVAYTFVNNNPGPSVCYLKHHIGEQRLLVGAVSGVVTVDATTLPKHTPATITPTTTSPLRLRASTGECGTRRFGHCGSSSGTTCCPTGQYCQPWDPGYYQCVNVPARCSKQHTDVDFYGRDLRRLALPLPSQCCDECARTPGCVAYTFITTSPGHSICYLKDGVDGAKRRLGAVSGQLA